MSKEKKQEEKKEANHEPKEQKKSEAELANEKISELTDQLQRLQAEFENYKKRTDKESAAFREYASEKVLERLLPIIDTFELAIKNTADAEKFKKGMELIYAEMMNLLKSYGVKKIDALGQALNPYLHDAMLAVESKTAEKDTVIEVLQEGYKIKEKVLRHAKVKIAK